MTAGTRQNVPTQGKPIARVKLVPRPASRRLEGTADGWVEPEERDTTLDETLLFYLRDLRRRA